MSKGEPCLPACRQGFSVVRACCYGPAILAITGGTLHGKLHNRTTGQASRLDANGRTNLQTLWKIGAAFPGEGIVFLPCSPYIRFAATSSNSLSSLMTTPKP